MLVKAHLRVGDLIAGGDLGFFQNHGPVILGFERENLGARRRDAGAGPAGGILVGDQTEFQGRGAAENTARLGGVLHTGQLHHDAVGALPLHHRVADAELVDPVVQRGAVLVDGVILQLIQRALVERQGQPGPFLGLVQGELRQRGAQRRPRRVGGDLVVQGDDQLLAFDVHATVTNTLVTQRQLGLAGPGVHALLDHRGHVHLQQEVHPAAQVQAQVHGRGAHRAQPVRRGGGQIKRHHVLFAEQAGNTLAGPQLRVRALQAHHPGIVDGFAFAVFDAGVVEGAQHPVTNRHRHLAAGVVGTDLNGRNVRIKIGQRIEAAPQ